MNETDAVTRYSAGRLLNFLLERINVKGDRQLAHRLGVSSDIIQGIRAERTPVSGSLLMRMADCAGCAVDELRAVLGDRRRRVRLPHAIPAASPSRHQPLVPGRADTPA